MAQTWDCQFGFNTGNEAAQWSYQELNKFILLQERKEGRDFQEKGLISRNSYYTTGIAITQME